MKEMEISSLKKKYYFNFLYKIPHPLSIYLSGFKISNIEAFLLII